MTGVGLELSQTLVWTAKKGVCHLIHRHWMCHHCQWNTRLLHPCVGVSSSEASSSTAILGSELTLSAKTICFPHSQHNNRVAKAVCGGDAAEKIGLKFNEHCTTWVPVHKVANHPHMSPFKSFPISGKNSVSQAWHENLFSFQG